VQKATELGVTHILPIACARSVVQLDIDRANKRQEHWRATAIAACEQCGRNRLPVIEPVRALADAFEALSTAEYADGATRGLLDPQAALTLAQWVSRAAVPSAPVALLIGPEGGLEDSEQALAEQHDFTALRLGPRILRTETAALAALAAIQSLAGDFA
jgi:16S rRNA (uracil1498-N3)-methyltransferase